MTRQTLDKFRAEMKRVGHAGEQVARHVQAVKQIYEWAVDRDLIPPTKVTSYSYKRSRDDKPMVIPEYSPREAKKLLGAVERAEGGRLAALRRTACVHGYQGPFVLFRPGAGTIDRGGWHTAKKAPTQRSLRRSTAKPDKPWTYHAFNQALIRLEHRAGVPHVAYRAAHGFRRYVINEVNARTGNLVLAGQYVGDKDLRTLMRSYARERPEELQRAVAEMEHTGVRETGASRNADATRAPEDALETELVRN